MENKKIAVVTGATSGIGKQVALGLVELNYVLHVIARNEDKFKVLKQEALQIDKNASLKFYEADLSLVKSTDQALTQVTKSLDTIDLLYLSAGLIPGKIELTEEGIEKTFAVSYLTRYLITKQLLPLVIRSNQKLMVNMAGAGQNGTIHFDDINFQRQKFRPMNVVKQFQQANDALTLYMDNTYHKERLKVYCLIPGLVDTGIHDGWPSFFRFFIRKILGTFIMVSTEKAAQIPLGLIEGTIKPDSVLVNNKGKAIEPSKKLINPDYQNRVIALSEGLVKT